MFFFQFYSRVRIVALVFILLHISLFQMDSKEQQQTQV